MEVTMSALSGSVVDAGRVQGFAAMKRYEALLGKEGKITEDFPGYVTTADQLGKDIEAEARKYQTPAEGFTVDTAALASSKASFEQRLGEVKEQAAAIDKLAAKVTAELKEMSAVTPPSARSFANITKIDPTLGSLVEKAFAGVAENNKQLQAWAAALSKLQSQMTTHIATAEKWMPTFCDIVTNKGEPLTSLQWHRWTSVAAPEATSATGTEVHRCHCSVESGSPLLVTISQKVGIHFSAVAI